MRTHHPGNVMVWAGVSWKGKAKLQFVESGVKIRARNYLNDILIPVVEPLNSSLFHGQPWTFQQDSAPAHGANLTQDWLRQHVPDFIAKDEWPSASPDLNPLDYSIWTILERDACSKPHTSVDALKRSLLRSWKKLSMDSVRTAIEDWPRRSRACRNAKGGHFED